MATFRDRLRELPVLPPGLDGWEVDLDALPSCPQDLFVPWFDEAVESGTLAPQAMTLSTADDVGQVHARTVILKDLTADGWWFAGHATAPKAHDLAVNPHAALTFLWPETGRQVRVCGTVSEEPGVAAQDFLARPDASRAAGLVGRQSEPLETLAEHRAAWADALETVRADPDLVAPTWTVWRLRADEVEFWRSGTGTGQTRVRYRHTAAEGSSRTGWSRELLWP